MLRNWWSFYYAPEGTAGGGGDGGTGQPGGSAGGGGGATGNGSGNGAGAGANQNTSANASGGTGPATPWYQGKSVSAEVVGHWQNRGWGDKSAEEIAVAATEAHRQAEKLIGVPANQLLRLPAEASDEAGWKNVWNRLGVPSDAKDYDFSGVKFVDGSDLDAGFVELVKQSALANHVTKDAAVGFTKSFVKYLEDQEAANNAERTAALETEKDELRKNWGAQFDGHMYIAKRAAQALGVTPEAIAALEGQIGYSKVMEMFRQIGSRIGEDKFVSNNNSGTGMLTREMAQARIAELKADKQWAAKYLAGDRAAQREMQALLTIMVGDDTAASRGR